MERLLQGAFAGEQRHVDRRGAGRQPHAEPGAGRVPLFPGVYLPLSGDPLRRRARPAAEHPGQGFARPGLDGLGAGRGGSRRGFGLPERVERRQFLLRVARRRDGPESARETLSGQEGRGQGVGREPDRQSELRTRRLRQDFPLEGQQGGDLRLLVPDRGRFVDQDFQPVLLLQPGAANTSVRSSTSRSSTRASTTTTARTASRSTARDMSSPSAIPTETCPTPTGST